MIRATRDEATSILKSDLELRQPEHEKLAEAVQKLWGRLSSEVS